MKDFWLVVLMLSVFSALLFSAGGGLTPDGASGVFVYFKFSFLLLPYATLAMVVLRRPKLCGGVIRDVIKENKVFLIYLFVCAFSVPLSVDAGYSLNRLIYTLYGTGSVLSLAVIYFIWHADPHDILKRHLNILTAFSFLPVIYIALTQFGGSLVPGIRDGVERNLPIHPNVLAAFYAQLLIWQVAQWRKPVSVFLAVVLVSFILLLFSRTVFLALCATFSIFAVLAFFWYAKRTALALIFLGLSMGFALLGFILFGNVTMEQFLSPILRGDHFENFVTLTNRTILWETLMDQVDWKTALLGHGYSIMIRSFSVDFGTGYLYGAHNTYLSIFLGCGVAALAVFLAYLLCVSVKIRSLRKVEMPSIVLALASALCLLVFNGLLEELAGRNTTPTMGIFLLMTTLFFTRRRA